MIRKNREALETIVSAISKALTIGLFPHVGVDGDCLGSALSLKSALEKAGYRVFLYVDSKTPSRFDFLPGIDTTTVYPAVGTPCDLGILVDCSHSSRIGKFADLFNSIPEKAVIDHHPTSECAVKNCCIDPTACATGELIYDCITLMSEKAHRGMLDEASAFNIYTAIFSDTGGFSYANTTSRAFEISGELFSCFRIDTRQVAYHLYEKTSFAKIKLEGMAYQATGLHLNNRIALCCITRRMMEECNAVDNDVDSICSSLRNVEGVVVAFVLREKAPDEVRVNIRSLENFDASAFAVRFQGGGHKMAAGFSVFHREIDEVAKIILRESTAVLAEDGHKGDHSP